MKLSYWWTYELGVLADWQGPYSKQEQALFAAQRDGNAHHTVHIKSMQELGPGMRVETGYTQTFAPNSIDQLLRRR